ncbi:MAG TPA: BrxA family protein [Flavitalea sp.]|nr:BrxA family protein [Flavitalea sp.]
MEINSDINILGGLPDFSLILYYLNREASKTEYQPHHTYTTIKTDKSVRRFENAIVGTLLHHPNRNAGLIIKSILSAEALSHNGLMMLFWNASVNNELLQYLNEHVYFPAFYSGKLILKKEEVSACLKELRETELQIKEWTIATIETLAGKYLTFLKKLTLMEGTLKKVIVHPYLHDKIFVLFIYWLKAIEPNPNILESDWLKYSFCERHVCIERLLQKKFSKYFQLFYTGDKLKIDTTVSYEKIYDAIK